MALKELRGVPVTPVRYLAARLELWGRALECDPKEFNAKSFSDLARDLSECAKHLRAYDDSCREEHHG